MADDVEEYRYQLTTVDEALEKDPENAGAWILNGSRSSAHISHFAELLKLRTDLLEMIALLSAAAPAPAPSAPSRPARASTAASFAAGQTVQARYSGDGVFYDAVIDRITDEGYVVTFTGYGNQETVAAEDVKAAPKSAAPKKQLTPTLEDTPFAKAAAIAAAQPKKRSAGVFETGDFAPNKVATAAAVAAEGKDKKKAKKVASDEKKELQDRVKGWQSFATKKGNKQSIFATGDDPAYRVGVTGSGKPVRIIRSLLCFHYF